MSATDQAFIRAYGGPAVSGKPIVRSLPMVSASTLRAPNAVAKHEIDPQIAATANSTKSWIARAEDCDCAASVLSVAPEGAISVPAAQSACIEIGLGSVIPAPHANFAQPRSLSNSPFKRNAAESSSLYQQHEVRTQSTAFGASQKASLSSFTNASALKPSSFELLKPALEIDTIAWPAICETLLEQHGSPFQQLVDEIRQSAARKQHTIAISGTQRNEGRTTLTLCLARALALKCKIAIVDADFNSPGIAKQLRIGIDCGWEAVLCGEAQLADVMIESIQDQIAIVPLGNPVRDKTASLGYRIGNVLRELAENYNLVLVDAGPVCAEAATLDWVCEANVDSVILAHDMRRGATASLSAACSKFAAASLEIGIAEMFIGSQALQAG